MQTSSIRINFIKDIDGYHEKQYTNVANNPAIGYGHTHGVNKIKSLTQQEAHDILMEDIQAVEPAVLDLLQRSPLVSRNGHRIDRQYQFDALVSFAFNCGTSSLKRGGLAKSIENGMPAPIIRAQFESWCFVDDEPSPKLTQCRLLEADLFFGILH